MRISSAIPNLVNGVSQQPAASRLSSQAEAQENFLSSVVDGLSKRPPVEYVAKLTSDTALGDAFLHTINRDSAERYKVLVTEDGINVWDINGSAKTVNYDDKVHTSLSAVVTTGAGSGTLVYIPAGVSTITLTTTGISGDTVLWEQASDAAFTSPSTIRTDTSDDASTYSWTHASDNGTYIRANVSVYSAGTITATITFKSINYLLQGSPTLKYDLKAQSIADYTLLLNKKVTCAMDSDLSTVRDYEAVAFAKQATAGMTYTLNVEGNSSTHTIATSGNPRTGDIISTWDSGLTATLAALSPAITATAQNPVYYMVRVGSDFTGYVSDDFGNQGTEFFKDKVQSFSQLPQTCKNGFEIEITGDNENQFSNYYVRFETNTGDTGIAEGIWRETIAQGIQYKLDAETMPHQLVREADGTFTYGEVTWEDRLVGDTDSNPDPSFIGEEIQDIFLFKNRLGFIADQNVIMSRSGEFFAFFHETVVDILPTAPIDVSASTASGAKGVAKLYHAAPFDRTLLLFSDQSQFTLTSGETLTIDTVAIDLITEYTADVLASPVGSGDSVFSPTFRGSYASVYEYRLDEDAEIPSAMEITAHIPSYIPGAIGKVVAAPNENILVALPQDDPTELFVHTYFWSGNEKLQSSWSKWTFNEATILNVDFLDSYLYIVFQRSDGVYLERILVSTGETDEQSLTTQMLTRLDRRIKESQTTRDYQAWMDATVCALPYTPVTTNTWNAVTREGATTEGSVLSGLTHIRATTNLTRYSHDLSGAAWSTLGATINADSGTDPDGGATADKIEEDGTTGSHRISQSHTFELGKKYRMTAFLRADERDQFRFDFPDAQFSSSTVATFDLTAKTAVDGGAGTATLTELSGGWFRADYVTDACSSAGSGSIFFPMGKAGSYSYAGTVGEGLYAWGFQCEEDDAEVGATPPIVTSASAVSRAASIQIDGDRTGDYFYIGERYTASYTFSTAVIKEDAPGGQGRSVVAEGPVVILEYVIQYDSTGYFQVTVEHGHAATTSTHTFTGPPIGSKTLTIGAVNLASGQFRVPCRTKNYDLTVTLSSDSFIPCTFQAAEWKARYQPRTAKRV